MKLGKWGKGKGACAMPDIIVDRTFLVVREKAGYAARRVSGPQDLQVKTKPSGGGCSIEVVEFFSHRSFTSELTYTLGVAGEKVTAAGNYVELDVADDPPQECKRPFTVTVTRTPLTLADLAFEPAVAAKELVALWDSDAALTLKQFCEDLPVMKTPMPRKAKATVTVDAKGSIAKLVIDGVEQPLDTGCNFPMALEEAEPVALTNRSGVEQTTTVDLDLR
ncbi:MAG: hypothetical protein H0T89_21120 [Deltaproteobacteria bacterium]|nr:hypothetical protein [Deltaproteobacteria bacterium]